MLPTSCQKTFEMGIRQRLLLDTPWRIVPLVAILLSDSVQHKIRSRNMAYPAKAGFFDSKRHPQFLFNRLNVKEQFENIYAKQNSTTYSGVLLNKVTLPLEEIGLDAQIAIAVYLCRCCLCYNRKPIAAIRHKPRLGRKSRCTRCQTRPKSTDLGGKFFARP